MTGHAHSLHRANDDLLLKNNLPAEGFSLPLPALIAAALAAMGLASAIGTLIGLA